ncbi:MAG: aldehyde dehydrogenase family protein [Sphingomonas sp.]|nr:aldehyde dehydrogenase family protein [Sphingomonas sp.]
MVTGSDARRIPGEGRLFIGGEWRSAQAGGVIDVVDPALGERVGQVAAASSADIDAAVAAATAALASATNGNWSPEKRQNALLALASAIDANAGELAQLEMLDAGKPISNVNMVDVPQSAAGLRYFAGWATKLEGQTMALSVPGDWHACTLREPVGVVGQIIPWNYPLMGAAMKIGPAIAAGCAVILKPAENTNLSALRLAELIQTCGFPPGMVNILPGLGTEAGTALVKHPDIAKIAFTGSTATGKAILRDAADLLKRVTVELGGKSPVIVMPDADIESAARGIAMGIFFNSGQTCSAGSRLLVHASVAGPLMARVAEIARAMSLGDPANPKTQLGPVISDVQRDRILGYVDRAVADGARCLVGSERHHGAGFYIHPTILDDVQARMEVMREEVFGPVLAAMRFETTDLDEIAALANDNDYGLSAYVWTSSITSALGLVKRLKSGTVRVNTASGNDFAMPAGGVKQSGNGRENGRAGVEAYTELKSVTIAL